MGKLNINNLDKYSDQYERKQKMRKRKRTEQDSDNRPQQSKRKPK